MEIKRDIMHEIEIEMRVRENALRSTMNGFRYCRCGANAIVHESEKYCVVCNLRRKNASS